MLSPEASGSCHGNRRARAGASNVSVLATRCNTLSNSLLSPHHAAFLRCMRRLRTPPANWFEERAPALKGVVADYGFRETGTTAKASHMRPEKHREFNVPKGPHRYGMVAKESLAEAAKSWADGAPRGAGFGAVLPTHDAAHEQRWMSTTMQDDFGAAERESKVDAMARSRRLAATAEARGSVPKEKVIIAGSQPTGEVYKDGADPQNNTAAQRSWLYSKDPMLKARDAPPPTEKPKDFMSLTLNEGPVIPEGPKGRRANVTLAQAEISRRPGKSIWADEIP